MTGMHVLGIDAGGTKTVCLLADADGAILSEGRGPGANLQLGGELEVEKVLHLVIEAALGDSGIQPAAACLGMAGADRDDDAVVVRAIMRRISRWQRLLVVNDALIALAAGTGLGPGIVIVAGTGSIAYGRNAAGGGARAGGWGHVIGDEGSAYWIGRRALVAVVRESDKRGPPTSLTPGVLAHFGVDDTAGLVRIVYDASVSRANVAALGPIVQKAHERGDEVATQILDRAAEELGLAALSVASRLGMRGDAFPFVLAGGEFRVVPRLVEALRWRLAEIAPRASARLLDSEPAVGAVTLALEEARGGARIPRYV